MWRWPAGEEHPEGTYHWKSSSRLQLVGEEHLGLPLEEFTLKAAVCRGRAPRGHLPLEEFTLKAAAPALMLLL